MSTTATTTTPAVEVRTIGPLCPECGVLIAYGDDSGQDPERVANAEATAGAITRDERGTLVVEPADEDTPGQVFRCCLCGDDMVSQPHTLVVVRG